MTTCSEGVGLGTPYDLVGSCVVPILKSYANAYLQVEISLVCASSPELLASLKNAEIDLAIVEEKVGPSAGQCLCVERLVWVGAKAGSAHLRYPLPISMVPSDLDVLAADAGRPALPPFAINLHVPKHELTAATMELARFVRAGFMEPERPLSYRERRPDAAL